MTHRTDPRIGAGLTGLLGLALGWATLELGDPDTLWHVLLGQRLWQTWEFVGPAPRAGLLSGDYVYNQWLPELAAAAAHAAGGLPGVAILAHLGRTVLIATIYLIARREAGPLASAAVSLGFVVAALGAFTARPQLVAIVLLAVVVGAWRASERDGRARWWLIAVLLGWGTCHGSWVIGSCVGMGVAAIRLGRARHEGLRSAMRSQSRLLTVAAVAAVVPLVSPLGTRVVQPFLSVREVAWFADEWRPAPWGSPPMVAFLLLVGLALAGWARRWLARHEPPTIVDVLSVGAGLVLALPAARGVALGAVIVLPAAARAWGGSMPKRPAGPAAPVATRPDLALRRPTRGEYAALLLPLVVGLGWAAVRAPSAAAEPANVPAAVSPALHRLPPGSVVFNDIALGGWLLWEHPQLVPVVDTRLESYGSAYLHDYVDTLNARGDWAGALHRIQARAALLTPGTPLATALRNAGWQVVARGDTGRPAGADRAAYELLMPPEPP